MKKINKLLAILLVIATMVSFTACGINTSKSLTLDVETGDSIKVKLDTSDGLSMTWDKEEDILKVKEDDDTILEMIFADEDQMEEYTDSASGVPEIDVKKNGKNGKIKYSLFAFEEEDETKYYIVGWIIGSDTGIIIVGSESKKDTMDAFESLSFSIEDTDQDDEDYYLSCVVMEEENDSEDKNDSKDETKAPSDETKATTATTAPADETKAPVATKAPANETKAPVINDNGADKDNEGNKNNQTANTGKLSNNWKDYEFSIDGHTFKLPVSYKELKKVTGYSIKSSEEKSYLEPEYYTSVQLRDADGNGICYIDILNNTDEDATYADCVIFEIGQTNFQQEDTLTVKFAGGLGVGSVTSKDQLIAMFGEPTKVYEYRSDEADMQKYNSDTYTWSEDEDWTTRNNIEIEMNVNTGVIEEIYLNCSDFK